MNCREIAAQLERENPPQRSLPDPFGIDAQGW
jgi:hypothetical protein